MVPAGLRVAEITPYGTTGHPALCSSRQVVLSQKLKLSVSLHFYFKRQVETELPSYAIFMNDNKDVPKAKYFILKISNND